MRILSKLKLAIKCLLLGHDYWKVVSIAVAHSLEHELSAAYATIAGLRRGVPYREFCRHPDKCAGLSICPRDPTCAD